MPGATSASTSSRLHDLGRFVCLFLALWLATYPVIRHCICISTNDVSEVDAIHLVDGETPHEIDDGHQFYVDATSCVYCMPVNLYGGNALRISFDADLASPAKNAELTIDLYGEDFDSPTYEYVQSLKGGSQHVEHLMEYNASAPASCDLRFMLPKSASVLLSKVRVETQTCIPAYVLASIPCLVATCALTFMLRRRSPENRRALPYDSRHIRQRLHDLTDRLGRTPPYIPVVLMYLVAVLVRFILAAYLKVVYTYPDELLYYGIARSLSHGQGIMIYNTQTTFQKLLYSLVLLPTFAIGNQVVRLNAIALVNSAVMASGIFPTYLLAKRMLRKPTHVYALCALYVIMSDLVYTMTFMSEIVFLPLALWLILGYHVVFLTDGPTDMRFAVCSATLGVLTYVLYLCKEGAVAFPAALAVLVLFEAGGKVAFRRSPLGLDLKRTAIGLVILVCTFGLCFAALKFFVFSGMKNYYHQTGLEVLSLPYRKRYLFYAFRYYLACCILAMGVIPFLAPLMGYRDLPKDRRRLYVLLVGLLVLNAVGIAYTITVREDFPQVIPRSHMRYACYLWMPFICVWLAGTNVKRQRTRPTLIGIVALACVMALLLLLYQGSHSGSPVDNMTLAYLNDLMPSQLFVFRHACLLLLLCFLVYGEKKAGAFQKGFLVAFVIIQLSNNAILVPYTYGQNSVTAAACEQALSLAGFIEAHPDEQFLVLSPARDADEERLFDTYVDGTNVAVVYRSTLLRKKSYPTGTHFADVTIAPLTDAQDYHLDEVDYLIALGEDAPKVAKADADAVELEGVDFAHVYRLKDATRIPAFR